MKRAALYLATLLLATACADQSSPTSPGKSLQPRDRSNALGPPTFDCTRSTGTPVEVSFVLSGQTAGPATLTVTDNGVQGLNGTITLNGEEVVTHPMLGGNAPVSLSVPVTLADGDNVLVCKLEGKPGSGLSFQVQ